MRRGFLFMLMWVLILRGLTGTAMAVGMVPALGPTMEPRHPQMQQHLGHGAGPAVTSAAQPPTERAAHHGELQAPGAALHHGQALPAPAPCDDASSACATHDHALNACSACEICHSAMLQAHATPLQAQALPGITQRAASEPFDSAPAVLALKPPIG